MLLIEGDADRPFDGTDKGSGDSDDNSDGTSDDTSDGSFDGTSDSASEGPPDGFGDAEGSKVGYPVGDGEGANVGDSVISEQQSRKTLLIVGQQSPERAEQAEWAEHCESPVAGRTIVPVIKVASTSLRSVLLGPEGATVGMPVIPEQHSRKTLSIVGQQSPERAEHAG
jgi:hypothetical protein